MHPSWSLHPNPRVLPPNFKPSVDLGIHVLHQTEQIESSIPTMPKTYVATDYIPKETVAPERVHGPRLTTRHMARPIPPPENMMPDIGSPLDFNRDSGMNADSQGYGSAADVNTLGPHVPVTIPRNTYPYGNNLYQQQSLPRENTHAHNANEYFVEANETTDSMTLGASDNVDGVTRALHWQCDGASTGAHALVHVNAQIRDSMTRLWPSDLQLVIYNAVGLGTWNLQEWIQRHHAAVSRMKCVPGTDSREFYNLIKWLRKCGGYATASWETRAFPVEGIPELPGSPSPVPDHTKYFVAPRSLTQSGPVPLSDPVVMPTSPERPYHMAAHDAMEPQQVDPNLYVHWDQGTTFMPVDATLPLYPDLRQQAFAETPLPQPNAQLSQQVATLNMNMSVLSGGNEPNGRSDRQIDLGTTGLEFVFSSDGRDPTLFTPFPGVAEPTTGYTDAYIDAIFSGSDVPNQAPVQAWTMASIESMNEWS